MSNSMNIVSMIFNRETHACNRDLQTAAEDKAASCEMDEVSCRMPENTRSTFLFTFSPDGTKVASAHGNHKIYVCDVGSGRCLHTLDGHPRTPWCITFHPNFEGVLASGCLGGEVRVWDLHGGCEVWTGIKNSAICSLTFHPFDRVLVIATTNTIYFWDWSQAQPFASCKTSCDKERVRFVRFDSLGHRLFTGIANVTPICRQREMSSAYSTLLELQQQFRGRNQRIHLFNVIEESMPNGSEPLISPSYADNLRLAREYAASQSVPLQNNIRQFEEISNSSVPFNFDSLLERVLDLRTKMTRVSEQLQSLLSSVHSEMDLATCVLSFWREQRAIVSIMRQFSPHFGFDALQSYVDARRRIVDNLFQLHETMHNYSSNYASTILQRHRRKQYIYNILATLLELASLDFSMLVRLTTRFEELGHEVDGISLQTASAPAIHRGDSELRELSLQHDIFSTNGAFNTLRGQSSAYQDFINLVEQSLTPTNNPSTASEIPGTSNLNNADTVGAEGSSELLQLLDQILNEIFTSLPDNYENRQNPARNYSQQPLSSSRFSSDSNLQLRSLYNNRHLNVQRAATTAYVSSLIGNVPHRSYIGIPEPGSGTPSAIYRIQCWDFTKFVIPDISNAHVNVVVPECLIQNDACIEISADDQLLATLVPTNRRTANILAIYSIRLNTFGQCLYMWNFVPSVNSVSLSPLGRYVLVGFGTKRPSLDLGGKLVIGQVLKLNGGHEEVREYVQHVRTVELRGENRFEVSLNSMRWLPYPGSGLVYGTNRGDLRICRPKSFNESGIRPSSSQGIGHDLARLLPWRSSFRRPGSYTLRHAIIDNITSISPVTPSTSSTGTQTESENN